MIKVYKDLTRIPESLIPAFADLFPERMGKRNVVPVPRPSSTTHARRMEVIAQEKYFDEQKFNDRYKLDDIKEALTSIYKGKCAFCEQKEEQTHVEHYRPKTIYYWLAFSWDNLLISCPTCNSRKGSNFDLGGAKVSFANDENSVRGINTASASYDAIESPKMVNPEITDAKGQITFEKDGMIKSVNPRFKYTIEKCQIDRKSLNDSRRTILDKFRKYIRDVLIESDSQQKQETEIAVNVRNFYRDSKDENEEFLAFRRYAITNHWLNCNS